MSLLIAVAVAVALIIIGAVFVYRATRPRERLRFPARYIRPYENPEEIKRARA